MIKRAAVVLGMVFAGLATEPCAAATDLASMGREDVVNLQRRLTDAGCYKGALDGNASDAVRQAVKACPAMDPVLKIETVMHASPVASIGVDRSCRLLATGAEDKTVRLWSLPDGRHLRTLRPPIGPGNDGKIFAVAVSPDGSLVAAGGWDAGAAGRGGFGVSIFDAATGALKSRIGAFRSVVLQLAFSPDGRHVAATLGAKQGLRVLDVEGRREVASDENYNGDSYGVAFAPDGRLFTTAFDGTLRAYDRSFRLVRKVATTPGKHPYRVAVDPSGERVAVGFDDSSKVMVYRTADLGEQFGADTSGVTLGLPNVAWSSDGRQLAAAGQHSVLRDGVWRRPVLLWDQGGRGPRRERVVAGNAITQIMPCGTGFAVGAGDPLFALLDTGGTVRKSETGAMVDMRDKIGEAFKVSRDGRRIRFGLGYGNVNPVTFDLTTGSFASGANAAGLVAARTSGIAVTDWRNTTAAKLRGAPLTSELSRSLAIAPDAASFVLGIEHSLRAYNPRGNVLWQKPVPGVTWGVNVTGDGRMVVAAYADGTIRWHRMTDGQELLALFVHNDARRWVAWTPAGYYQASPGAEDLIGWHLNRGWEQTADFYPASRFRGRFNRPDIVQLVLETLDEDAAVTQANAAARRRDESKAITHLPPVLRITSPADGSRFSASEVTIGYDWRSPSGLRVDKVDVLIDGRPLQSRGFDRLDSATNAGSSTLTVALPGRDVEVALIARAGDLTSEPARIRLAWSGGVSPGGADILKPKLYVLSIGVSDYAAAGLKLGYAAKDARDFADALQAQSGGMYGAVETRVIVDREVTRASVIRGLNWLEQQVTSRDVGVVFLAGHGVADRRQNYWFLPFDTTADDVTVSAVSQDDIKRTLQSLAGKAMLFLDTCHAGQALAGAERRRSAVDINAVVNEFAAAENGVVAFASSTGRQVSVERDDWQNGAFTKALVEGLRQGRADLLGKGTITLSQLDAFVANRVKELTGGTQHPVMTRPPTVPDYPIAIVRR